MEKKINTLIDSLASAKMRSLLLILRIGKRSLVEDVSRLEIKQTATRTSSFRRTSAAEKSNSSIERERKRDSPPEGGRGGEGEEGGGTRCKSVSGEKGRERGRERERGGRGGDKEGKERQECGARSGGERAGG